MSVTHEMKKIKKLAKAKGLLLKEINVSPDGVVSFVYHEGARVKKIWYPNFSAAIRKETLRLK